MMFCIDSLKHYYFKPLLDKFDGVFCYKKNESIMWIIGDKCIMEQVKNNMWYDKYYFEIPIFDKFEHYKLLKFIITYFGLKIELTWIKAKFLANEFVSVVPMEPPKNSIFFFTPIFK